MKPEYLAEEIRDGIKGLKARLDIPPAEDCCDLNGYMDALIEDCGSLLDELEAEKAELEKQEPAGRIIGHVICNGTELSVVSGNFKEGSELYTKPQPPAVPDGWQLVPIEPTREMLVAMAVIVGGNEALHKSAWSDALSAAPKEVE